MKKFLGGVLFGHLLTNLLWMYSDGGFERVGELIKRVQAGDTSLSFAEMFTYIIDPPKTPEKEAPDENTARIMARILKIRAMSDEGFPASEIAEQVGLPEVWVSYIIADAAQ